MPIIYYPGSLQPQFLINPIPTYEKGKETTMGSKRGREVMEDVAMKHSHNHLSALAFAEINKGRRAEEAEDIDKEGKVVESNGHFDFGGSASNGEHQITSYSSEETNVSECTTEETATTITKNTSISETNEIIFSEIFKGQKSSVSLVNIDEEVKVTEEEEEYDVEKVLKNQETHDLFCPNCSSCITKTVVLTRKGKVGDIWGNIVVDSVPVPIPPQEPDDRKPIFYRCLSCFNIFICSDWFWRRGDNLKGPSSYYEFIDGQPVRQDVPQFSSSQTPAVVILNKPDQKLPGLGLGHEVTADEKKKWVISNIPSEGPSLPHNTFKPFPISNGAGKGNTEAGHEIAADETNKWVISNIPSEGPSLPHNTFKPVSNGAGKGRTNAGKDVVIPMPGSSQPDENSPLDAPLLPAAVPPSDASAATYRVSGVGIIKAMVYGGLLESIASLSVVSSAAGTNTATINILALGIANLMGGLCALFHKLRILKHETRSDEYKEAFGEPGHFWLHTTVAVLSYIFFGLLPPVLYAFTFRQTDVRDYKMIPVAVSSLLSVVLLSGGKAHVRSSDQKGYLKTVSYYVSLAVMASGVSFVVGDLLEWLLTELGWFSSSSSSVSVAAASASY